MLDREVLQREVSVRRAFSLSLVSSENMLPSTPQLHVLGTHSVSPTELGSSQPPTQKECHFLHFTNLNLGCR